MSFLLVFKDIHNFLFYLTQNDGQMLDCANLDLIFSDRGGLSA